MTLTDFIYFNKASVEKKQKDNLFGWVSSLIDYSAVKSLSVSPCRGKTSFIADILKCPAGFDGWETKSSNLLWSIPIGSESSFWKISPFIGITSEYKHPSKAHRIKNLGNVDKRISTFQSWLKNRKFDDWQRHIVEDHENTQLSHSGGKQLECDPQVLCPPEGSSNCLFAYNLMLDDNKWGYIAEAYDNVIVGTERILSQHNIYLNELNELLYNILESYNSIFQRAFISVVDFLDHFTSGIRKLHRALRSGTPNSMRFRIIHLGEIHDLYLFRCIVWLITENVLRPSFVGKSLRKRIGMNDFVERLSLNLMRTRIIKGRRSLWHRIECMMCQRILPLKDGEMIRLGFRRNTGDRKEHPAGKRNLMTMLSSKILNAENIDQERKELIFVKLLGIGHSHYSPGLRLYASRIHFSRVIQLFLGRFLRPAGI